MVAAMTRAFVVYWTDAILDECTRNLVKDGKADNENMKRMVADMKMMFPYATIPLADYEGLIPVMTNHPKDRHVLAAAVARGVNVIVTNNVDDFKQSALEAYLIETQTPDEFICHVLDLAPSGFIAHFVERNNARRAWAEKMSKLPRSDIDIAAQLAKVEPPMPKASENIIKLLS